LSVLISGIIIPIPSIYGQFTTSTAGHNAAALTANHNCTIYLKKSSVNLQEGP